MAIPPFAPYSRTGYGAEPIHFAAAPDTKAIGATLNLIGYACLLAFVFCLPWEDAMPLLGGFIVGRWFAFMAIGVVAIQAAIQGRGRRLRELHYWMLAFAAWSGVTLFWSVDWDSTMVRIGTYTQLLLIAWLIWMVAVTETRVAGLLFAYVLGTCVCALGTISEALAGRTTGQINDLDAQASDRYSMGTLNANDLGLMLALSIPMALYLVSRRKSGPLRALACWMQFGLVIPALLLTGSRGSALAASASLLMLPAVVVCLPRWQKLLSGLVCAGAAVAGFVLVPLDTWQRFLNLSTEVTEGTMTHRTQIWADSLQLFREHPLFGVGSGAHTTAIYAILGRAMAAHNTFLSVLVELGVVGELIFLGLLAAAFYCAWRMFGTARLLWLSTLLTWCIGVSGVTWEYQKATWFLFSLLVAHSCATDKFAAGRFRSQAQWSPPNPRAPGA